MSNLSNSPIVLHGHTSFETAYVIEDYPYGRTLRCKKKIWIEEGLKGSGKGQFRVVYQTTNPKKQGEYWNKPKASTFATLYILYLDPATGHVETDCFTGLYHVAAFREKWYDQLDDHQKTILGWYYQAYLDYEKMKSKKAEQEEAPQEEEPDWDAYHVHLD